MDTQAAQKQLVGLITQHLSESIPVTRILTYKPDKNGSVTGRFESLNRVFNFVFSGNDVRYKPAMNSDSSLFSKYYLQRLDAAPANPKGSKALPKCTSISYSCKGEKGVRCLPLTQNCKIGTDAIGKERLNKIKVLSKSLAASGEDNSKIESARAKLVEQRMKLAVENRVKRSAQSLGGKVTVDVKPSTRKAVKDKVAKPKKEKLIKAKNEPEKVLVKQEESISPPVGKEVQKTTVQVRDTALKDARSGLVNRFGEKLVKKAESNIQEIIKNNNVMIRVPSEYIDSIIKEGRMLNSGEVRERKIKLSSSYASERMEDATYQAERDGTEERSMGIPINTPSSGRPIYGYAGNSSNINASHQKNLEVYGDVAFTLKPEVKDRSSLTIGDSFFGGLSSRSDDFSGGAFATSSVGDTGRNLEGAAKSKTIDDFIGKTDRQYLEYQIQGGVKTSDIAEMHFTNGKEPSKNTIEWAKKNGVKIFTYAKS
jgi:hypothetical protein